jgi:PLP dependent protein
MPKGRIDIRANMDRVTQRIQSAALRVGRKPEDIRMVAVTKTVKMDAIREALANGVRIFGENRVQEALPKITELKANAPTWHFVGHLQTNKVRQVAGLFDLIHSVDSAKLVDALHASMRGLPTPRWARQKILVQVNISGEKTKHGIDPKGAESLVKDVTRHENLRLVGLMTVPPLSQDPESSRPYYGALRELARSIEKMGIEGVSLHELSMGMSSDFEVAIEEGATLVRIGTAIFGQQNDTTA